MAKKIILIHGLGGTTDGTWGEFPNFLDSDNDLDFDIISCGYESPSLWKIWKIWKRAPSVLNVANGILTDIKTRCDIESDEIILAGHSLGGIILKKVLLLLENRQISHKIVKVCFFDVPHDGSGYANAVKCLAFRNRHLKSLTRGSSELDDLNEQWISSRLNNSLEIMSIISAYDDIVSSSSSKSIFREHQIETINHVDHCTIVKPKRTDSLSYVVFKRFILQKNTVAKYKIQNASRNLEDWKRIERNHSYPYASDEKRAKTLKALVDALELEKAVIRITGASGLGKTRLLLEGVDKSSSIDDSCMLIFNAPGYDTIIKENIRSMVDDRVHGLVVIENCNIDLHNHLAREVNKTQCMLKLVTVGYSDDQVDNSIRIQLSPLSDEAIKQLLTPILVGLDAGDVDRVARFAQGYPLMATLIADQYQKEGRLLGSIESNSVVRKLIDGDGGITDAEKEMLSACSLFDVFGTAEGTAGEEAKYIAELAGSTLQTFDKVIRKFSGRQIINCAGKYARLVPKPLALTLASEWWEEASYERQQKLIDTLPNSLMQSFCTQASYLDNHPNVQRFSDRLFGGQSPFSQAEGLLTERGSKLFRAFVEVNPESTSDALYHVLSECSHEQLQAIGGGTRRNLVWGLEKLCFHAEMFEKSSWCMLLLASAENEDWSNNATGMFAQLFRVDLSGTQAKPHIRFDVLNRAIKAEQPNIDMVVLEALDQSISIYGGTRIIGSEYQGTKAPLEEWRPELWQEIFDFWQQAFDLMLVLFERGDAQKEKILSDIGHSIRGFVAQGRIEMLDSAIRKVVSNNGCYWPAALGSIKNTFEYDSEDIKQEATDALNNWLALLSPDEAELPDKLKILVTNPPWEHHKGEDGHYVDVAAENAKTLATELSRNIEELLPHLGLLLMGEQKQSDAFGYQLAHELADIKPLIDFSLDHLVAIEQPNLGLILGLYRGLFEQSPELWQENIDRLLTNEKLAHHYPHFIRTGDIQKAHLDTLLQLIQQGVLSTNDANVLSYGGVTNNIDPDVMADFCLQLVEIGEQASWAALNVIYMYCFSNTGSIDKLRDPLKLIVTAVPLHKGQESIFISLHHWHNMAEKLLKVRDQEFATALTNQLVSASKYGLDYGDMTSYTNPLMINLMEDYTVELWPILGDAIVRSEGIERHRLRRILEGGKGLMEGKPSVLSVIPVENVIEWCSNQPESSPVFIAGCLNVIETIDERNQPSALFIALLETFGDNQRVAITLSDNIGSRSWSGSLVPYLESEKSTLQTVIDHENPNVRRWVSEHIAYIDRQITEESKRDEEYGFGIH